jgi:glucose 1-dehydrogenase
MQDGSSGRQGGHRHRRELEGGETTVRLIEATGGEAIFVSTDIAVQAAVIAMMRQAVIRFGRLDVLVNNAAIYTSTKLIETTPEHGRR